MARYDLMTCEGKFFLDVDAELPQVGDNYQLDNNIYAVIEIRHITRTRHFGLKIVNSNPRVIIRKLEDI